jgi:histidyl-tRNA synthetase
MKISSVKGFHDVLPDQSARWARLEQTARDVLECYGFAELRLPIVERTELFRRSIGDTTDIVEKEMYTFTDRDDSSVTLRPEGTASVVRAYVEHSMHVQEPVSKLYYLGPMFRRERPQKGRLRQFSQVGVEVIGRDDAAIDAEVLMLLNDLLAALQVRRPQIELNSLGCAQCRPAYRDALLAFGEARRETLCDNCKRRLELNPLRLLDCKNPDCQAATAGAPTMIEHLCAPCQAHFDAVQSLLTREDVRFRINARMVRGLDYYCRTAFEVVAEGLGAQNAVGGGGRYDGLVKALGGPEAPGIGFALGVERLLLSMQPAAQSERQPPEIFIAALGDAAEAEAVHLAHRWRREGVRVETASAAKSLKSQMRLAGRLDAAHVVIIGEDELGARRFSVRDMAAKRDHPRVLSPAISAAELRQTLARLAQQPVERRA